MAKDTISEQIVVERIERKSTKANKPYWQIITEDGEYYSAWSKSVADQIASFGKDTPVNVSVEVNESGDKVFKNILGVESEDINGDDFLMEMGSAVDEEPIARPAAPIRRSAPAAASAPVSAPTPSVSPLIMARSIGIQVAATLVASGKAPAKELISAAERATQYILDGVAEQKSSSTDVNPSDFAE